METIEIKQHPIDGTAPLCHEECSLFKLETIDGVIHTCKLALYYDGPRPTIDCPGPGLYDLVPHGSKTYDPATQVVIKKESRDTLWHVAGMLEHIDRQLIETELEVAGLGKEQA